MKSGEIRSLWMDKEFGFSPELQVQAELAAQLADLNSNFRKFVSLYIATAIASAEDPGVMVEFIAEVVDRIKAIEEAGEGDEPEPPAHDVIPDDSGVNHT